MTPKTLLVAVAPPKAQNWFETFRRFAPARDIRLWPDAGNAADIAYIAHWGTPRKLFADYPNLRLMLSAAAGVDYILGEPNLPQVPLIRTVHPDLSGRMAEYVALHVLRYHRHQPTYEDQQRRKIWKPLEQAAAGEVAIGIMGMGAIGTEVALVLSRIGFKVAGWSKTAKNIPGVESFHGPEGLDAFLARTEIVVSLLPMTPDTRGIFNMALFRKLKRDGEMGGAYFINAARGRQQVDADILAALEDGTLAGVTLDVFPMEPIEPDSPYWTHPRVTITPHNAADIGRDFVVKYMLDQIDRFERGLPLENVVDRGRGY